MNFGTSLSTPQRSQLDFVRNFTISVDQIGSISTSVILSLLIFEHMLSSCLFTFFISFSSFIFQNISLVLLFLKNIFLAILSDAAINAISSFHCQIGHQKVIFFCGITHRGMIERC